jgi:hypothetical protein
MKTAKAGATMYALQFMNAEFWPRFCKNKVCFGKKKKGEGQ